jgi:hypothetical protein
MVLSSVFTANAEGETVEMLASWLSVNPSTATTVPRGRVLPAPTLGSDDKADVFM